MAEQKNGKMVGQKQCKMAKQIVFRPVSRFILKKNGGNAKVLVLVYRLSRNRVSTSPFFFYYFGRNLIDARRPRSGGPGLVAPLCAAPPAFPGLLGLHPLVSG
jgi:hypothetical protein